LLAVAAVLLNITLALKGWAVQVAELLQAQPMAQPETVLQILAVAVERLVAATAEFQQTALLLQMVLLVMEVVVLQCCAHLVLV
jgi:hypothetical protein